MKCLQVNALAALCVLLIAIITPTAHAGLITVSLGNDASGLVDGDTPIGCYLVCVGGIMVDQDAPFDKIYGHQANENPSNVNWLFNYGAITDTIISASFSFGIWDLDSAASGSQLDSFALDGINLTSLLDTLFEGGGGAADEEYRVYTLTLDNSFFTDLADGLFSVDLDIGGNSIYQVPVLIDGILPPPADREYIATEAPYNRYALIYSTLSITTEDTSPEPEPPTQVPEPSSLLLFMVALFAIKRRLIR